MTTKMNRLKSNWKKLAVAILGLGGIIYFILTGKDIDLTAITSLLQ